MKHSNFSLSPVKVESISTKFREIKTKIPVPESISLLSELYSLESSSMHGQMPIIWDKAYGFQVEDPWGNKWIDFTSTIFVANAGHGNKRIISSLYKILKKPLLHTYNYASLPRLSYLRYLLSVVPKNFEKAFLLSAGTEATEVALKLMRLKAINVRKKKPGIISFTGNWHGRTMGAQFLGSNIDQKSWIGFQDPNIHHLDFPYPWVLDENPNFSFRKTFLNYCKKNELDPFSDFAGVMMETFQGWGAIFYPSNFVREVRAVCNEFGLLLAFDEMQSGFGRTGKLFGYQHYDVIPDLICCGKGASSSLPLSIVLGTKEIMDLPDIGSMSSTHSANPMVCAAGEANLRSLIEDDLVENSKNLGIKFHQELNKIKIKYPKIIKYIFGKGLLAGVIFNDYMGLSGSEICDKVVLRCLQRGLLLVHTGRESIKLAPPLSIYESPLIEGITVFEEAIISVFSDSRILNES